MTQPATPAQPGPTGYPVRIRGDRDEHVSRWLFLVKWFLLIPHIIVLVFLLIGFVVVWIISLFAILFTGKYPRGMFDYNVGVLRWLWRVDFYGYGALGTDRYPPFSLNTQDDYPADLYIRYPEKLSQGLVLVKWWLLAIPHWIVVSIFGGASFLWWTWGDNRDGNWGWQAPLGGLRPALLIFAAIATLFTGNYPRPLWDIIMGMNHWIYRVYGYASLTTDEYPPFRLGE